MSHHNFVLLPPMGQVQVPELAAVHHGVVVDLHPGEAVPGHLAGLVTIPAQESTQCCPPDLLQLAWTEPRQLVSIFIPEPGHKCETCYDMKIKDAKDLNSPIALPEIPELLAE